MWPGDSNVIGDLAATETQRSIADALVLILLLVVNNPGFTAHTLHYPFFFDTQAVLLDAASNLSLVDLMSADVGSSIRLEPRD